MTIAQRRALDNLLPRYLLQYAPPSATVASDAEGDSGEAMKRWFADAFGRHAPLALEIGFGHGNALVALAKSHPDWNCLGLDVYQPGFGALALACDREEIDNVRVLDAEATAFLGQLPTASVRRIHVFFPDPWPKKRHRKRRLVNAVFAARTANCLEPRGCLALATDWQDYAEQMLAVLNAEAALRGGASARSSARPITPFEAKALAQGRNIVELTYRRVARDERSTPSAGEGSPSARSPAP